MKKIVYFVAGAVITFVTVALVMRAPNNPSTVTQSQSTSGAKSSPSNEVSGSPVQTTGVASGNSERKGQEDAMTHLLGALKQGLKDHGIQEGSPISVRLQSAVATKNHAEILRAFNDAIYSRDAKLSEVLPAIRSYLADSSPFVRLTAAKTLLTAGDRSGVDTLIDLVKAPEAIADEKSDLRLEAASTLAHFRETSAADGIFQLYKDTSGSGLLSALATLGDSRLISELQGKGFVANKYSILRYGILQGPDFSAQLESVFNQHSDLEMKSATAWALARMGKQDYANYLVQIAQTSLDSGAKARSKMDPGTEAIKYLGSVDSANARQVLENALDSSNAVAVRYAAVNLLMNQTVPSDKARQLVLNELRGQENRLGQDLTLNLAVNMADSEIAAAGEAFQQRAGDHSWQYAVARKSWPIYNWIDSYVVALRPSK